MDSDLDPFIDILPEPAVTNARAGGKFQPKAKPHQRKESSASVSSALPSATKEKHVTVAPTCLESTQSIQSVDVAHNRLTDPASSSLATSDLLAAKESFNNIEDSSSEFPTSDDSRSSELVNPLSQLVAIGEDLGSVDALPSEVAISDNNGDWHSSLRKSWGEVDSMGLDLDPFDDILPEPSTSNGRASAKFQPKAKFRPQNDVSASILSTIPNAKKEKPDTLSSTGSDTTQSVKPAEVADIRLVDPVSLPLSTSKIFGHKEPLKDNEGSLPDDNGSSGLVKRSSPLDAMKEDVGSRDAPRLEVAISDSNDPIGFDLDPFADGFLQPATSNARPGGKFQPKAKPHPRNETSASVTSAVPNAAKEKLVGLASADSATTEIHGSKEPLENNDCSFSGVPLSDDNGSSGFVNPSSHIVGADAQHLEVSMADGNGDWHSSLQKSAGENADIFSGLEYLDDFLSQSTTATDPVTCREAAVSNNDGDFQIDNGRLETEFQEPVAFSGLETLDIMADAAITSGQRPRKFLPKPKVQSQKEKPIANNSHPDGVESVMSPLDAELIPPETEDMDEGTIPAFPSDEILDFPSVRFSDSILTTSELLVSKEPTNLVNTSHSDAAIPGDDAHSEAAPKLPGKAGGQSGKGRNRKTSTVLDLSRKPQKSLTVGEENEYGVSSRWLRKHRAAPDMANGSEDGAHDSGGFPAEPPSDSVIDEDENNDDEYRAETTSRKKRTSRKKPVAENEKPVRKRKKANEVLDQSNKEPPKKFSHSTRRNKRRVDKALLETPEDEIDLRKLCIKDLIQLAEFRERISNKEATTSNTALTNQRADNSFHEDAPDDEEETFVLEQDRDFNDNQANIKVQRSSSYYNYQSYMDKTPSARWSKQDTELFYEAVQQFGTDFSMVQQLFPGRTRNQIKLKYKKEERQHPLRLSEAVKNRAKDHSHFELVIDRLKQAAQAEQDSNGDDSIDMTGKEEELEEVTHEINEETAKSEPNEEVVVKDQEADIADVHSPVKFDESDDDLQRWSQYKSEF